MIKQHVIPILVDSLFKYHGRFNRLQYIGYHFVSVSMLLGAMAVIVMLYNVLKLVFPSEPAVALIPVLLLALSIVVFYYSNVCISIKRLHDIGLSGYHYFWIALLNIIGLQISFPMLTYNNASVTFVLGFIILAMLPGNKGENRYNETTINQ